MLMIILWVVAALGLAGIAVGAMRLKDPVPYAKTLAAKAQRKKPSNEDLQKSRSSGYALLVVGPVMIGLWAYAQFFMR